MDELFIYIKNKVIASTATSKTLINIGELLHQYRNLNGVVKCNKSLKELTQEELLALSLKQGFSYNITDVNDVIRVLRFIKVTDTNISIISFHLCFITHVIEDCFYDEFTINNKQIIKVEL